MQAHEHKGSLEVATPNESGNGIEDEGAQGAPRLARIGAPIHPRRDSATRRQGVLMDIEDLGKMTPAEIVAQVRQEIKTHGLKVSILEDDGTWTDASIPPVSDLELLRPWLEKEGEK
jgi:hypothetical protein